MGLLCRLLFSKSLAMYPPTYPPAGGDNAFHLWHFHTSLHPFPSSLLGSSDKKAFDTPSCWKVSSIFVRLHGFKANYFVLSSCRSEGWNVFQFPRFQNLQTRHRAPQAFHAKLLRTLHLVSALNGTGASFIWFPATAMRLQPRRTKSV